MPEEGGDARGGDAEVEGKEGLVPGHEDGLCVATEFPGGWMSWSAVTTQYRTKPTSVTDMRIRRERGIGEFSADLDRRRGRGSGDRTAKVTHAR